ncbi:sensor histidine kinase [Calothrix sp. NIES-3974]|uniref:sensor histidine kinase n=1 Tax=Calothrix sp. NIES-3974 TaxID=2005462 RepID=UPI000B60667B|nr:ATP-binding protein [Calothrix sp. NIES-3974]BAZ05777.1 integral membrane sensor signal transduction histidine kinase [Calothrix sp. NIES-3974]
MLLSKLSLRLRILAAFLTMGILILIVGLVGLKTNYQLSQYILTFSEQRLPLIDKLWVIQEAKAKMEAAETTLLDYKLNAETRKLALEKIGKAEDDVKQVFAEINKSDFRTQSQQKLYEQLVKSWHRRQNQQRYFLDLESEFHHLGIIDPRGENNRLANSKQTDNSYQKKVNIALVYHQHLTNQKKELDQECEILEQDLNSLFHQVQSYNLQLQKQAVDSIYDSFHITIISMLMGIGLSISLGIFFSGKIAKPIDKKIQKMLRELEISRDTLELQVKLRTEELEATLDELKNTQQQLIQSEKMSSLGQMVGGIAHEINNPATFIHGNLAHAHQYSQDILKLLNLYRHHYPHTHPEIVAVAEELDIYFVAEDLPKVFDSMREGTLRIKNIVTSLRNFSRLDEAEKKEVNINEGIESTLLILSQKIKCGIKITKNFGDIPKILCYPAQLNQVFMSIISNAIDALETNPQQQNKHILISTTSTDQDTLEIKIKDNGIGIEPEIIKKIFDPFFTTKPVGKGTGLGLSVSYQIIQKHQGKIEVNSHPGEGSEFIISLPIKQPINH